MAPGVHTTGRRIPGELLFPVVPCPYGWWGCTFFWFPLHPVFASKTRVRDAGTGLLCMQTKAIKEGWQGHFGDKARIQNDLDKLDEMAPNTEVKRELRTTAKCCPSAGDTDCTSRGKGMEAQLFFQKGAGTTVDTGQESAVRSAMRRHGALQLYIVRGMVPLLT